LKIGVAIRNEGVFSHHKHLKLVLSHQICLTKITALWLLACDSTNALGHSKLCISFRNLTLQYKKVFTSATNKTQKKGVRDGAPVYIKTNNEQLFVLWETPITKFKHMIDELNQLLV
jgi:hypothetical protein